MQTERKKNQAGNVREVEENVMVQGGGEKKQIFYLLQRGPMANRKCISKFGICVFVYVCTYCMCAETHVVHLTLCG